MFGSHRSLLVRHIVPFIGWGFFVCLFFFFLFACFVVVVFFSKMGRISRLYQVVHQGTSHTSEKTRYPSGYPYRVSTGIGRRVSV